MLLYVTKILAIGLLTGILSGMFGVGGALLSTPAIRLLLHVAPLIAVGTPLPVVIPTAISGGIVYLRRDLIALQVVKWAAPAGMVGAILGATSTKFVSGHYLLIITALIILYVGARFLRRAWSTEEKQSTNTEHRTPSSGLSPLSSLLVGLVAGFVGGLLGIGGGIILIPAFVFLGKMSAKKAFGSSLITIAFMAIPGTVVHYLLGHIDWMIAAWLTLGVIPGAYLGARFTEKAEERALVVAFGLFLIILSLYFALSEFLSLLR